jgi:hypothetical protein
MPLLAVHIDGSNVTERSIVFKKKDPAWERVPYAHAVGVPLMIKRLPQPNDGAPN